MIRNFNGIIRYLVIDFECRKNCLNEWTICAVAISGLDQKLKIIFESMEFTFSKAIECNQFYEESIENIYGSDESFQIQKWEPEWFVKNLYEMLSRSREKSTIGFHPNIQLVSHNLDFDQSKLAELFKIYGYPFYVDDADPKGIGRKGYFEHLGIDPMHYGQLHKAKNYYDGRYSKSDLDDTCKALGIPVLRHYRHTADYDCYLATIVFLRMMDDMFELEKMKENKKSSHLIPFVVDDVIEESVF